MAWDFKSDRSIYIQIVEQIKFGILSGKLKPDDKVGSVRELAKEASVNPNTMQKALSELEKLGFVYKERSKGRFITKDTGLIEKARKDYANGLIESMFIQMQNIGYENDEIIKLVDSKNKEDL